MIDDGSVIITLELTGKGAHAFEELRHLTNAETPMEVIQLAIDTLSKMAQHQSKGGIIHLDRADSLERKRLVSLIEREKWLELPVQRPKLKLVKNDS